MPEAFMIKRTLVLILCCAFVLTGGLAAKQKKGRGKGDEDYRRFRQTDIRIIVDYYRGHGHGGGAVVYDEGRGLPPGLAKKGQLPPGLAKQLRRNGRLPPGLEKKLVAFPVEVERYLPACPAGHRRGLIEGQAVIYNERTGIILDIFAAFGN